MNTSLTAEAMLKVWPLLQEFNRGAVVKKTQQLVEICRLTCCARPRGGWRMHATILATKFIKHAKYALELAVHVNLSGSVPSYFEYPWL